MSIFMKRLILLSVLFTPVQLTEYKLVLADFDTGRIVYENDVHLSTVEENTYKITSSDGERSFRACDIITMIGTYVEFDSCDLKSKVRCLFKNPKMARVFARKVKANINSQVAFPLDVIAPGSIEDDSYHYNNTRIGKITGAALNVELGNRFIATSDDDGSIVMIFTATQFNVSPVFLGARMFMILQTYDIRKKETVELKFYLTFPNDETANRFHKYVKQDLLLATNNVIPVVIPRSYYSVHYTSVKEQP